MSRVFVVGAPSGTGKTTLLARLVEQVAGLCFSVSHTTRAPRAGERDGKDYHFVSRAAFEAAAANGELLEWAEVYGNLYGTHRSELERSEAARLDLVLDIDVQGARSMRKAVPDAALVLILPPSLEALEQRLRERRTESEEALARRLREARAQLESYELYDYAIVNDDLERALRELEAIVTAERLRVAAQRAAIVTLLGGS